MTSPDLPALIARVRELDAEATKGPWFYNSYSGVFSEPVSREYDVAVAALPDDAPAEAFDGLVEPCCAHVPVVGGDTATAQGARDAALIAAYRTAAPLLAAECSRLQERVRVLEGEREEAREWVRKMQRANTTTCIFCGLEQTGIDAEQLRAHAATCSRHPLRVLTEALRPFAECGPFEGFARDERIGYRNLTVGDFDAARAALEGIEVE